MQTIFQAFFGSLGVAVPTSAQCWRWPQFYIQLGLATFEKGSNFIGQTNSKLEFGYVVAFAINK